MRFFLLLLLTLNAYGAESSSLERVLAANRDLLNRLGGPLDGRDEKAKSVLKETVGKVFNTDGSKLKVLTNHDRKSAWFGGIVVFVDPDGRAYFVDAKGKWFTEHLKDRIIGGTLSRVAGAGSSALLTFFYGKPGDSEFYAAYLGTTKLKVISFKLDRESGNITGNIKMPTGRLLKVTRIGRDNANVKVNGIPLIPLFL